MPVAPMAMSVPHIRSCEPIKPRAGVDAGYYYENFLRNEALPREKCICHSYGIVPDPRNRPTWIGFQTPLILPTLRSMNNSESELTFVQMRS